MYGMIPSAKIDRRLRLPPTNMLNMPKIVPPWALKKLCRAWVLIPGVGMKLPTR